MGVLAGLLDILKGVAYVVGFAGCVWLVFKIKRFLGW